MSDRLLKTFKTIGLILALGMSMSACAGLLGFGGDSWKEEVLLHDGSKIIVKRSQSYGGRHEIGQPSPIKEHTISFKLPGSKKTIEWTSEYSEDVGHANFDLLAVHVLNGTPYIVTTSTGCLSYGKWGRPNPPYVFFKYDGKEWQRIPLAEFPSEFKTLNVARGVLGLDVKAMVKEGLVSAENVKRRNSRPTPSEHRAILLREPLVKGLCPQPTGPDGKPIPWDSFKAPLPMKPRPAK